ncbi:phage tail tape measure protein [Dickeya dianthicola]|uniref:phage tail tape measure protein n=1 Tax=Dickeya dianthicola TaxID=204039 RepID=UPI001F60C8C8|nr:phage tail tape measure protein [Dickeya dianthicola]MCI4223091.1 phage tail tape measure protein [Dickeya dianthicola]
MSNSSLRLQVVLDAVDKLTRPLRQAQAGSKGLSAAIKASQARLKELDTQTARIDGFRKASAQAAVVSNSLKGAREEAARLATQFAATERPTAQQARLFQQAKDRVNELQDKYNSLRVSVQRQREALNASGIDTKKLSDAQRQLRSEAQAVTDSLQRQQQALKRLGERQQKLNAIKSRHEKTLEARNKLAGTGGTMVATGVATAAPMIAPIKAYADSEDAATQLAGSMMGPGAKVSAEFEKINTLAVSLGDRLPGTTADFQNMMTMLRRQGLSAQSILGGTGEAAAYLGVQLKMAPTEAAEFAAKMQDATGTVEKDMMPLMDIIQKGFYAGVDPTNMLGGFAKIGSAMSVIEKKGIDAAKAFAPLLVMADQQGMEGGSAGNAYRKVFQAGLKVDKVADANDILKESGFKGIKLDFTNGKGHFGGIEKMYAQFAKLASLQKNNPVKAQEVITKIFGDDAEVAQVVNNMIEKGIDGYRETQAKLEQQASLRERVDAQLQTLGNKWDAATGSFTNAMASIGATVAPDLKRLIDELGEMAGALNDFVKTHPVLVGNLFKLAAGFAITATAVGILFVVVASVMGPLSLLRMSLGMLGLQLPTLGGVVARFAGLFGGTGSVFTMLGRVLLWLVASPLALLRTALMFVGTFIGVLLSPVALFMAAVVAVGVAIYQHWEPINAFLSGVVEGFQAAAAPIVAAFEPLKPVFAWVSEKVQALWKGFTDLLEPVKWSAAELNNAAAMGHKFGEFLADGLSKVMHPLDSLKAGVSWLLEKLGVVKTESDKLPSADVIQKAQDAKAAATVPVNPTNATPWGAPPVYSPFAGMYDSGGVIPAGQFGIVGENGPEIVNGPARITSRRRTAALAAAALGAAASPLVAQPMHPFSLPASQYSGGGQAYSAGRLATAAPVTVNAPISIYTQPGQNATDIAREVARQLDERERRARAKSRSNYSDQGGIG